ncbi:hypothetical protein EV656_1172 [Rhodovulum adriaticum]|uniref:Uncharacterized protein n=1 Tax=Rhodovulum adriaticum TaxID=35804 RepID=A0A4R2NH09_RHOAD|nr:hypothetical protein EV656_1172 [Rhodovulum adriaticum]
MGALSTSPSPAVAESAFVPLSILPDPVDQPVSFLTAVAAQDGPGVMTIDVGPICACAFPAMSRWTAQRRWCGRCERLRDCRRPTAADPDCDEAGRLQVRAQRSARRSPRRVRSPWQCCRSGRRAYTAGKNWPETSASGPRRAFRLDGRPERRGRECPELCVSGPAHAVSDAQASKRSPNIMANWLRAAIWVRSTMSSRCRRLGGRRRQARKPRSETLNRAHMLPRHPGNGRGPGSCCHQAQSGRSSTLPVENLVAKTMNPSATSIKFAEI